MAKRKHDPAKAARRKAEAEAARELAQQILLDRPGNARPTPERARHGVFALRLTDDAGVRCAVDEAATRLDRLHRFGAISVDQCQAGHDYADLMRRTRITAPGRSCLNFDPVGEDHGPDDATAADDAARRVLLRSVGIIGGRELRAVCVDECKPRDMAILRAALDVCAKFFGRG